MVIRARSLSLLLSVLHRDASWFRPGCRRTWTPFGTLQCRSRGCTPPTGLYISGDAVPARPYLYTITHCCRSDVTVSPVTVHRRQSYHLAAAALASSSALTYRCLPQQFSPSFSRTTCRDIADTPTRGDHFWRLFVLIQEHPSLWRIGLVLINLLLILICSHIFLWSI